MTTLWKRIKLGFDRSFSHSWWQQLLWLFGIAMSFMFAGWIILLWLCGPVELSWWKSMAYFFDTNSFHNDHPIDMEVPPLFSVLFTFIGMAVMSGALISVIVNIITQRVGDFREGHIRYGFKKHIVILGSGDMLINMIRYFRSKEFRLKCDIVVLTTTDIPSLRDRLHTFLLKEERRGLTLLYGRRDSAQELKSIKIWSATAVYITGEETECEHDTTNIRSLEFIRDICVGKGNTTPLPCHVIFEYQPSLLVMQYAGYNRVLTEKNGNRILNLHVTNLFENRAQNVLVSERSVDTLYYPLDRGGITRESDRYVHLVVFGMGRMGRAMAETAAHIAHYPNFEKGKKTIITFVSPDARREMDFFTGRHESLFKLSDYSFAYFNGAETIRENHTPESGDGFLDVVWEFIEGGVEHPQVRNMIAQWSGDKEKVLTLALCDNSSPSNISAALYLPQQVYDAKIPVLVYQPDDSALVDIACQSGKYSELRPFGMLSGLFDSAGDERVAMAQKIMYVYDHYFEKGTPAVSLPPVEKLVAAWNDASLPVQWSNIYMANTIPTKYRSIGLSVDDAGSHKFTREEIEMMSRVEHQRWNMEKLLLGYRPVTTQEEQTITADPSMKKILKENYFSHYDLRPFDDLRPDHTGKNASEYDRCIIEGLAMVVANGLNKSK